MVAYTWRRKSKRPSHLFMRRPLLLLMGVKSPHSPIFYFSFEGQPLIWRLKIHLMQAPLKFGWLTVLMTGLLFVSCSHKLAPEGHYQTSPMVTDGKTDDWPMPLRFSNASYTLQYNVTNDDKALYVCVSSREAATQLRILRSGMTIRFDPKGEKNKTIGLYFPIRKQPDPRRGGGGATGSD